MTSVLRSDVALSNPLPGPVIPPPLGISGVLASYVAGSLGPVGTVPPFFFDSPSGVRSLRGSGAVVGQTGGVRHVTHVAGQTLYASPDQWTPPASATLVCVARWAAAPAANAQIFTISNGNGAIGVDPTGKVFAYSGGGTFPTMAAASSANTWHRIVATFNSGTGSISVDGIEATGATPALTAGAVRMPVAPAAMGLSLAYAAIIDHALTTAEKATIDPWLLRLTV